MRVTVKFFAQLKDAVGLEEMCLEVPAELHAGALAAFLSKEIPDLESFLRHGTQIALNCEFIDSKSCFRDGDEIALLPPFSGG